MIRAAILALVVVGWLQAEPVGDAIRRAEQLEQAQQTVQARAVLARTAEESPDSAEALLAYAEFLDRFRDSGRSGRIHEGSRGTRFVGINRPPAAGSPVVSSYSR